jgi:hypothetical protein
MNAEGDWVFAWVAQAMFSDTETTTKGEQEVTYQASLDATAATTVRSKRTELLADTDWTQLADAPADASQWATYRQALRDITDHESFPYLTDDDWPE